MNIVNKVLRKNFYQIFRYRLISLFVSWFVLLGISLHLMPFKGRFPWQDLLWNDLALHNNWRWVVESIQENGFLASFNKGVDFRQSTGEFIIASTKSFPNIFDLGAISILLLNVGVEYGFIIRQLVFVSLSFWAVYLLYKQSDKFKEAENWNTFPPILIASIICLSPIFYHEVGPLNQFFLFLVPCWLYVLIRLADKKDNDIQDLLLLCGVLFLSIGVSDLFIFFNIFSVFLFVLLLKPGAYRILLATFFFCSLLVALFFFTIFYEKLFPSGSMVSKSGGWDLSFYYEFFLKPMLGNAIFLPYFPGPSTLFIHATLAVLVVQAIVVKENIETRNAILKVFYVFLVLVILGVILHGVGFLKNMLPGVVRYHLSIAPILLASVFVIKPLKFFTMNALITAFVLLFSLIAIYKNGSSLTTLSSIYYISLAVGVSSLLCVLCYGGGQRRYAPLLTLAPIIPLAIFWVNSNSYNFLTSPGSLRETNSKLQASLNGGVQSCINDYVERHNKSGLPRSFAFVAPNLYKGKHTGRNDTLMMVVEQPEMLFGRTFNQWRYGYNEWTIHLNSLSGRGFTSWPFSFKQLSEFRIFLEETYSPFVISASKREIDGMVLLGYCYPPEPSKYALGKALYNQSLYNVVGVHYYPNFDVNYPHLGAAAFKSTSVVFDLRSDKISAGESWRRFPVAYHKTLRALSGSEPLLARRGNHGSLEVLVPVGTNKVILTSYTWFRKISYSLILIVFLIGTASVIIYRRNNFVKK